jgi:alpha-tubulin suppressor-like RCC1 family protein
MTDILACGTNFFGQLGIGDREREEPTDQVPFAVSDEQVLDHASVADIQCGAQFTVVLQKSGTIGFCGALNGNIFPILNPIDIPLPVRCLSVACGRKHVLLLMERNVVMSFGTGYFGQLGHNNDSSWDSPRVVQALESRRLGGKVTAIACGGSHSGALTDTGRVFMWGLNRSGQCGQGAVSRGKTDSILEPRVVDFSNSNTTNKDLGGIQQLVCGRSHSAALTGTGRVFSWGDAGFGRLGLNDARKSQPVPAEVTEFRSTPAVALAAGDFHMLALTREKEVYSWGYGADGQTGHCAVGTLLLCCPCGDLTSATT